MMPNGDPRDGIFYPTLTLLIDSYNIFGSTLHMLGILGLSADFFSNVILFQIILSGISSECGTVINYPLKNESVCVYRTN